MAFQQTYDHFKSIIREKAPAFPRQRPPTETEEERTQLNNTFTFISGIADGVNAPIPDLLSLAVKLSTANNASDSGNAAADTAVNIAANKFGGGAGPVVGGFTMLSRGAYQSLNRTSDMLDYLLGTSAYINCLARSAMEALNTPQPYVSLPRPIVPSYVANSDALYSEARRRRWHVGYWKVNEVIREIDNLRPVQGDLYSKNCLIQIALDAGFMGGRAETGRLRLRLENFITNSILDRNIQEDRNTLRRWTNAP